MTVSVGARIRKLKGTSRKFLVQLISTMILISRDCQVLMRDCFLWVERKYEEIVDNYDLFYPDSALEPVTCF